MDDNAVINTSKRQRNNHLDLVDRISALPDFILGDILSFLPTEDAVATSILSKRWKSAWVMVRNLDFCHYSDGEEQNDMKFIEFVDRVFLLHDVGPLNKFRLWWFTHQPNLPSHVSSWINAATTRHLQELSLHTLIPNGKFEVPGCVFSCVSLRCLHLDGCRISLSTSLVVCLPRLKTLLLMGVKFESDEVFEKLISGCRMLNHLHLLLIQPGDYIISSTSLRHLFLHCLYGCSLNLKLEASSLEYLKLGGCVPKIFVLKSLSSNVEVDIQISSCGQQPPRVDVCDSVVEAVSALDCTKALTLSDVVMSALSHGILKLSTKFNRLVKLKTNIRRQCGWRSLQDLIQHSDNLQVLTINQYPTLRGIDHCNRCKWTTPAEVPSCLSKSLKEIVFEDYHGAVEDEDEMIRYMLTHGSVLEVMRITCAGKMNNSKIKSAQKICEYPRKSPFCVVSCLGWTSNNNVEVCFTARPST